MGVFFMGVFSWVFFMGVFSWVLFGYDRCPCSMLVRRLSCSKLSIM